MAEVASAFVSLMPSAKGFGAKLNSEISGDVDGAGKKQGLSFGKLFAAGAALGLGAKAFSFLGDSLAEATDAAVVGSRTENVIAKMGNAANISAGQVANLAGAISTKTGIDDEAIQSGQNLLLTFGNIRNEAGKGNDIFNQTSQLMVDMSAAMGTDAKGSAIQLGKALNDPVKGITALSRVGVSFTEGQKAQIAAMVETGNTMGAQKVILGELERQFGGAAAAMTTPAEKAKVAWGNLQEQFGTLVLPAFNAVATTISTRIVPAIASFLAGMQSGSGAGGRFAAVMSTLGSAISSTVGFINQHKTALTALAGAITAVVVITKIHTAALAIQAAGGLLAALKATKLITSATKAYAAVQWLLNAALTANPIGLVIAGLVALGAGLVIAYKKSATFRKFVDAAFAGVRDSASAVVSFFTTSVPAAFNKVQAAASKALGWIKGNWPTILAVLTGPFGIAAALIIKNWDSIKAGGERVITFIQSIPGKITAVFSGAGTLLSNAGSLLMAGLKAGIDAKIGDAIAAVQAGLSKIKGMLPGSPIKWGPLKNWNNGGAGKRLMDLVAKGIASSSPKVIAAAEGAFGKIGKALEKTRDSLKSTLDGLKGDFASLAESVANAFTGDLFGVTATEADSAAGVVGKSVGQNFVDNLLAKKGQLTGLMASFNTLKGWGIDPAFLSQLFASGNGALITELAGMGQAGAVSTAGLFGEVISLGDQLGNAVASNDPVAAGIATTNKALAEVNAQLKFLNGNIDKKLSAAVERGAEAGTRKGNDDRNKGTQQRERAGR